MRHVLLALLATACSTSSASKLDDTPAPPRNFVCERVKLLNDKTPCEPEFTDVGDGHAHTARVKLDKETVICGLTAGQLAMVCDHLEVRQVAAPAAAAPVAPPPAKAPQAAGKAAKK